LVLVALAVMVAHHKLELEPQVLLLLNTKD
jgi:hypothetical protein